MYHSLAIKEIIGQFETEMVLVCQEIFTVSKIIIVCKSLTVKNIITVYADKYGPSDLYLHRAYFSKTCQNLQIISLNYFTPV